MTSQHARRRRMIDYTYNSLLGAGLRDVERGQTNVGLPVTGLPGGGALRFTGAASSKSLSKARERLKGDGGRTGTIEWVGLTYQDQAVGTVVTMRLESFVTLMAAVADIINEEKN